MKRIGAVLIGGITVTAAVTALVAIFNPQAVQLVAGAMLVCTIAGGIAVAIFPKVQRPLGSSLTSIGSRWAPAPTPPPKAEDPAINRADLDVYVSVSRPPSTADLQFNDKTGATPPQGWYWLDWRIQFATRMDLTGALVAFVDNPVESHQLQQEPLCLFRWHATVFKKVTSDAFSLDWMAIDGVKMDLQSSRTTKTARYTFGPPERLRNQSGQQRLVSMAIRVARSDRGGEILVPIAVSGFTRGVVMKVQTSISPRPSFDVKDGLIGVDGRTKQLLTWRQLFGPPRLRGVFGVSTTELVQGSVDFVITP